jgi:hypothetical protein
MSKIINVGGTKMLLDDDGRLHPIPKKYYETNEARSNNFAFKRPKQEKKVTKVGEVYDAINDKSGGKCNKVTRVVLNKNTMEYLTNNPSIQNQVYDKYGLHMVEHVLNKDIEDNLIFIHYADMRYIVISVGKILKKRKHFAENLLYGDDE